MRDLDCPPHQERRRPLVGGGDRGCANHARVANLMVPMTESEAKACGLPPSHARGHFRVHTAKTNFSAPSTQTEWFKFASINLGNGTPEYPNGDNVQVVERFVPAQAAQGAQGAQAPWFDPIVLRAALATLDTGEPQSDGSAAPFSAAKTMRKRVVTTLVSGLHGGRARHGQSTRRRCVQRGASSQRAHF